MKKNVFLTTIIAFFVACGASSGQDLKPLKSFDNDVNEYLKGNLVEDNTLFKGCRFGDVIDALEVKFLTAEIRHNLNENRLFMFLYLQSPEFVYDRTIEERLLTGITIYFQNDDNLGETIGKIMESFPRDSRYEPIVVSLTDENMDKLITASNNSKIRAVRYQEIVKRVTLYH